MAGIFISYRRGDAAPWAGRVYERLVQDFPRDHIFMDVDNIAPGLDFFEELERSVGKCDALIAVIGKGWTDARNAQGVRRLDDPNDFVRIELEAALQRNVRVIPVLVDGATMPTAADLPEPLQKLARRNAVELTHARFGSDVQRLVGALKPVGKAAPGPMVTKSTPSLVNGLGLLGFILTTMAIGAWIVSLFTGVSIVGVGVAMAVTVAVVLWKERYKRAE